MPAPAASATKATKSTNPLQALRVAVATVAGASLVHAAFTGGYAPLALCLSAALATVTVAPSISRGAARRSAATLGAAAVTWVAGIVLIFAGQHGTLWSVVVIAILTLLALVLALGVRALERPAACAPSPDVRRALDVLPGIATDTPIGAGGTILAVDERSGMTYLVGQVPGDGDTFEDSLPYQEFTAVLTRVRRSLQLDATQLRGVVVIPDLDRFGPLRVKGADEVVVCSKSQLRKALARKLRGK